MASWFKLNPERAREIVARYRARNPDKVKARRRAWEQKNRERINAAMREWRKRNPEKSKENARNSRARHAEAHRLRARQWQIANPDKVNANNAKRKSMASASLSHVYRRLHLRTFCHWCNGLLTPKNRAIDHVIPLVRGGTHSEDNLVASCSRCNASKGKKFYWEWDEELAA